jgi:hypothetical protein
LKRLKRSPPTCFSSNVAHEPITSGTTLFTVVCESRGGLALGLQYSRISARAHGCQRNQQTVLPTTPRAPRITWEVECGQNG